MWPCAIADIRSVANALWEVWGVNYLYGESVLYMMKLGEPLRIMDFKTI